MSTKPREHEVRNILRPHQAEISDLFHQAWDSLWRNPDRAVLNRRTQACLVHNYLMNLAIPALRQREGVHVVEKHETAFFIVDQRLLFRLKKGDDSGMSSNIGTQASLAFVDPDKSLALFSDLPDIWRVDVAYVLNYLNTKINRIVVVARDEDRIIWSFPIFGGTAEGELPPGPTVLPIVPHTPPPADSGMRIAGEMGDQKKKDLAN